MSASAHRNGHVTEYDTTAVGGKVPTHLLSLLRHWTLDMFGLLVAGDGPPQDRGCGLPALPPAHAPRRGLAAARGPRHRQVPLPVAGALQTAAPAAARRPRRGTQEVVRGERRRQAVREGRRAAVQVSCDWSAAGILTSDWRRLDTDNTDSVSLPSSPMGSRKIGLGYLPPPSQVRYLHNIYNIYSISAAQAGQLPVPRPAVEPEQGAGDDHVPPGLARGGGHSQPSHRHHEVSLPRALHQRPQVGQPRGGGSHQGGLRLLKISAGLP